MTDFPDIVSLIPHDGTMSLLDRVISSDASGITAVVTITETSLFCEAQGVPSWVGLEYMGQAIAAHAGLLARASGEAVKIGFLVSCRRYDPGVSHFSLGTELVVSATSITEGDTGLQVFECRITSPSVDFSANLNVFMPEDAEQFLRESV